MNDKKSGIYKITNIINNDCYIGKSKNIEHRWKQHKYRYKKDEYKNYYIYRAFKKYGIENFKFEVLEYCDEDILIEREQYYYDLYNPKYCMIPPRQDFEKPETIKEYHRQKCKEAWTALDEKTKNKIYDNLKLGTGGRKEKVKIIAINIETEQKLEFESLLQASTILNIARSSISQILNPNHTRKQSKGYTFIRK